MNEDVIIVPKEDRNIAVAAENLVIEVPGEVRRIEVPDGPAGE